MGKPCAGRSHGRRHRGAVQPREAEARAGYAPAQSRAACAERAADARFSELLARSTPKSVGKAAIGGAWQLIDQNGKPFSNTDLKGKFALLYFGFTHCPDICPDELVKMAEAIDLVGTCARACFARRMRSRLLCSCREANGEAGAAGVHLNRP